MWILGRRKKITIGLMWKSAVPIVAVDSRSHSVAVAENSDPIFSRRIGGKGTGGNLSRAVVSLNHIRGLKTGMDLIQIEDIGATDGFFFCLTLTAGQEVAKERKAWSMFSFVDVSGRHGRTAGKLLQARI